MARRGDYGAYVPTTQVWDVSEIYSTEVTSPEFKELLVRLYQNLNTQSLSINNKSSGMYDTSEFVNGKTFFPNPSLNSTTSTKPTERNVFRKVINFGALPNTATKSVVHDITATSNVTFTQIYGATSNPTGKLYLPLPYASSVLNDNIELYVDATQVHVITVADYSAYTTTYIILEYLKS